MSQTTAQFMASQGFTWYKHGDCFHRKQDNWEEIPSRVAAIMHQLYLEGQIDAYKHGLLTGAMPEAIGKPMAEDYIATLTNELNELKKGSV